MERNGVKYFVVDIFGLKGFNNDYIVVKNNLMRCIFVILLGFYCIVWVIFVLQRIDDMDV